MKAYPVYKKSEIRWIGNIPNHWEVIRVKHSDIVIMGQSPNSNDYNLEDIGLPFLQGNADFTKLHPRPRVWCDTANKIAEKDDVLVSVRAPIGSVNIADQAYGIGRGLCAIRSNSTFSTLLFYFFIALNEELNSIGTGSTYTAISVDDVKNTHILKIPPLNSTPSPISSTARPHKSTPSSRRNSVKSNCSRNTAPRSSTRPSPEVSIQTRR